MMVSHCDSETRSGFMAVLSARFSNLTEVLRQTLSPMDFVFSLKVGCKLFDRHAPEMVIMASLVTPFVGRLDGEVLAHLNADERSLADAASEALADPHCVAHAKLAVQDIVLATLESALEEKLHVHSVPDGDSNVTYALEMDAFRSALLDHPHVASFEKLLRQWAGQHHWAPVWVWTTRPIYRVSVNDSSEAFDELVNLVAATGFYYIVDGTTLLVRALPSLQGLLDRLMVSIAAHYPNWLVDATEEFPRDCKSWDYRRLTIDMKSAIYRRIALGQVKAVDPYPAMRKLCRGGH